MTPRTTCTSIMAAWTVLLMANEAVAQLAPLCVENSPERRGELGCSVIVRKVLPEGIEEPVYWHIDSFDSIERLAPPRARRASLSRPTAQRG
jgi:hypothetical protein